MILFFDRSVGTAIPRALIEYPRPRDITVEFHQQHFDMAEQDDVWLPIVGAWGWTVIGQDHNYHNNSPELAALRTYNIGAFYLWGSEAEKWETMRCFARSYDNILHHAAVAERPFVYKVQKHGGLTEIFI